MRSSLRRWLPFRFRTGGTLPPTIRPEPPIPLVPSPRVSLGETECMCRHWDPKHARGVGRCSHPGCGCLIMRPRVDTPRGD